MEKWLIWITASPTGIFCILSEIFTYLNHSWTFQRFFSSYFFQSPPPYFKIFTQKFKIFYINLIQLSILSIFVSFWCYIYMHIAGEGEER